VEFLANNQPDIVVRTMVSTLVKTGLGSLKPRFAAAAGQKAVVVPGSDDDEPGTTV
jgi:hypothetical protein